MIVLRKRPFNVDQYLEQQLSGEAPTPRPVPHPYGWCGRLNDRCDRWLDRIDWMRIDIMLGNLAGIGLTGVVIWLGCTLFDAWFQGRFNLGGQ